MIMEERTKICRKCGVEYPISWFYRDRAAKDGRKWWCKLCEKQYRQDNKEHFKEYGKKYNETNKEHIAECNKIYRAKHKEAIAEKSKKYKLEHKEAIAKSDKIYREANKNQIKEYKRKYQLEHKEEIAEYRNNNPEIGRECRRNQRSKRRGWGTPQPINEWFEGCHLHHLHIDGDHRISIYVPQSIHTPIKHSHSRPDSMIKINLEVLKWYYGLTIDFNHQV